MRYGPRGPGRKERTRVYKAGWDSGLWNAKKRPLRKGRSTCSCCTPTNRIARKRAKAALREERDALLK